MKKICVFAGTTEGRELVDFLTGRNVAVTACVATEYGETLLAPKENLTVSARRMSLPEMEELLRLEQFPLVVDATHPYASEVTENIFAACEKTGTEYLRLLREESRYSGAVTVADVDAAVDFLNTTQGRILLTTGSKELPKFARLEDFSQRVFARVLPMQASLESCREAGVKPAHIIAMQGPFSKEMNVQMLRYCQASFLVTKDGGDTGGFAAKAEAAREAGATLVVIGRPPQKAGKTYEETVDLLCRRFELEENGGEQC